MKTTPRSGMTIAGASIVFSTISSLVYFAFTPVLVLSALLGAIGVAFALGSSAKRTALVTAVFALVPLGQLLMERFFESTLSVLVPAALAIVTAAWALLDYSACRKRRR